MAWTPLISPDWGRSESRGMMCLPACFSSWFECPPPPIHRRHLPAYISCLGDSMSFKQHSSGGVARPPDHRVLCSSLVLMYNPSVSSFFFSYLPAKTRFFSVMCMLIDAPLETFTGIIRFYRRLGSMLPAFGLVDYCTLSCFSSWWAALLNPMYTV